MAPFRTGQGRVAVGSGGGRGTRTGHGPVGAPWTGRRPLRGADGYAYATQREAGASSSV